MKHTVESLMALADAYAEISIGSTTAHAVEMQEALRAALAEALKERDALKLDAERYCVLRDSKYQLGEDDISVSDSSFNVFFEQDLDKAVDALRHRYEAVKGAA